MIQQLFGGKKQEYFLEFDDAKGTKTPEAPAKAPKTETAPQVSTKTEPEPQVSTEAKTEAQPKTPVVEETKKPAKNSIKSAKKVAKAPQAPAPTPKPVAATAQSNGKTEPQGAEFATKYFITPTGSRRRPGPSLDTFKTMAREVKVPRS